MSRTKKITEPHYELLYIVSNKYTEKEIAPIAEKIQKLIKDSEGVVTYTEDWGKKKLAYPINHFNHGYYFLIEFDLVGVKLNWVNTEIRHMSEVLRHQIISKKKRSSEEIADEKRIVEKQAQRALEKKAEAEAEESRPSTLAKKTQHTSKPKEEIKETIKKEKIEEVKEEVKPKSKEEVQLNLDKLDEKLDKILDTDDLL
ncbi:MAG: 30S ribosomal protein S6 [Patescibacteria group bacterium]|jgi:small subunit ribosomal protein S6|nr:30S ribosomal protein S6 [Patescibacteria group bacterium]